MARPLSAFAYVPGVPVHSAIDAVRRAAPQFGAVGLQLDDADTRRGLFVFSSRPGVTSLGAFHYVALVTAEFQEVPVERLGILMRSESRVGIPAIDRHLARIEAESEVLGAMVVDVVSGASAGPLPAFEIGHAQGAGHVEDVRRAKMIGGALVLALVAVVIVFTRGDGNAVSNYCDTVDDVMTQARAVSRDAGDVDEDDGFAQFAFALTAMGEIPIIVDRLAGAAPPEIESDFEMINEAISDAYSGSSISSDPLGSAGGALLDVFMLQRPMTRVDSFTRAHCDGVTIFGA